MLSIRCSGFDRFGLWYVFQIQCLVQQMHAWVMFTDWPVSPMLYTFRFLVWWCICMESWVLKWGDWYFRHYPSSQATELTTFRKIDVSVVRWWRGVGRCTQVGQRGGLFYHWTLLFLKQRWQNFEHLLCETWVLRFLSCVKVYISINAPRRMRQITVRFTKGLGVFSVELASCHHFGT
jgi:hypothetical protein